MDWVTYAHHGLDAILAAGAIIYTAYRAIAYIYRSGHFIEELAHNHLPHIYNRLEAIEKKLGLNPPAPPLP